jgi:accessory colonization factor AcfC
MYKIYLCMDGYLWIYLRDTLEIFSKYVNTQVWNVQFGPQAKWSLDALKTTELHTAKCQHTKIYTNISTKKKLM